MFVKRSNSVAKAFVSYDLISALLQNDKQNVLFGQKRVLHFNDLSVAALLSTYLTSMSVVRFSYSLCDISKQ